MKFREVNKSKENEEKAKFIVHVFIIVSILSVLHTGMFLFYNILLKIIIIIVIAIYVFHTIKKICLRMEM